MVVALMFAFFILESRNLIPEYNFEFWDGAIYFAIGIIIAFIGCFVIKNNAGIAVFTVLYTGFFIELFVTKQPSYLFKTAMIFLGSQLVALSESLSTPIEKRGENPLERGNLRNNLARIVGAIGFGVILVVYYAASTYFHPSYVPTISDGLVYLVSGLALAYVGDRMVKNITHGYLFMMIVFGVMMLLLAISINFQPAAVFQMAMCFIGLEAMLTWLNISREHQKQREKQKRLEPIVE